MTKLPRIACFHGGGSTAAIYELQCSFIVEALKNDFQLEFFEGPFERSAGPGILPAFSGYDPYKSWFKNDATGAERPDGSGYDHVGRDGVERVWKMMEARQGQGGEWVGVMGFSQGTRIAGGLLLDQQRREELGIPRSIRLKFGVLCMGGGAPMESDIAYETVEQDTVIRIPTLHMHGLKDEFLVYGQEQYKKYYDDGTKTLYEINYHHAMPWVREESDRLAELIRTIYKDTQGGGA